MHLQTEWRAATTTDVPALLKLIVAAYRGPGGWTSEAHLVAGDRIAADQLRAAIAAADTLVMVVPAPTGDGLLACCELRDRGEGVASFGMFAVDPVRQAGGIGRRLLTAARTVAAERFGADTLEIWVVSVQEALIAWYERRGFTATGESVPFPDDGRDRPLVQGLRFIVMRAPTGTQI
jgi:GNAT superfamily N-acetyltransferase